MSARFFTPSYRTTGWRKPSASGNLTPSHASVTLPTIWPSMKLPMRPIARKKAPGTTSASAISRRGFRFTRENVKIATAAPASSPCVAMPPSQSAGTRYGCSR